VAWNEMSPESGAAYQLIWTEQKTLSCGKEVHEQNASSSCKNTGID
jgi:hypothetical protein